MDSPLTRSPLLVAQRDTPPYTPSKSPRAQAAAAAAATSSHDSLLSVREEARVKLPALTLPGTAAFPSNSLAVGSQPGSPAVSGAHYPPHSPHSPAPTSAAAFRKKRSSVITLPQLTTSRDRSDSLSLSPRPQEYTPSSRSPSTHGASPAPVSPAVPGGHSRRQSLQFVTGAIPRGVPRMSRSPSLPVVTSSSYSPHSATPNHQFILSEPLSPLTNAPIPTESTTPVRIKTSPLTPGPPDSLAPLSFAPSSPSHTLYTRSQSPRPLGLSPRLELPPRSQSVSSGAAISPVSLPDRDTAQPVLQKRVSLSKSAGNFPRSASSRSQSLHLSRDPSSTLAGSVNHSTHASASVVARDFSPRIPSGRNSPHAAYSPYPPGETNSPRLPQSPLHQQSPMQPHPPSGPHSPHVHHPLHLRAPRSPRLPKLPQDGQSPSQTHPIGSPFTSTETEPRITPTNNENRAYFTTTVRRSVSAPDQAAFSFDATDQPPRASSPAFTLPAALVLTSPVNPNSCVTDGSASNIPSVSSASDHSSIATANSPLSHTAQSAPPQANSPVQSAGSYHSPSQMIQSHHHHRTHANLIGSLGSAPAATNARFAFDPSSVPIHHSHQHKNTPPSTHFSGHSVVPILVEPLPASRFPDITFSTPVTATIVCYQNCPPGRCTCSATQVITANGTILPVAAITPVPIQQYEATPYPTRAESTAMSMARNSPIPTATTQIHPHYYAASELMGFDQPLHSYGPSAQNSVPSPAAVQTIVNREEPLPQPSVVSSSDGSESMSSDEWTHLLKNYRKKADDL